PLEPRPPAHLRRVRAYAEGRRAAARRRQGALHVPRPAPRLRHDECRPHDRRRAANADAAQGLQDHAGVHLHGPPTEPGHAESLRARPGPEGGRLTTYQRPFMETLWKLASLTCPSDLP